MYLGLGSHQRQQVDLDDVLRVSSHRCWSPKSRGITLRSNLCSGTALGKLWGAPKESLWARAVD